MSAYVVLMCISIGIGTVFATLHLEHVSRRKTIHPDFVVPSAILMMVMGTAMCWAAGIALADVLGVLPSDQTFITLVTAGFTLAFIGCLAAYLVLVRRSVVRESVVRKQ